MKNHERKSAQAYAKSKSRKSGILEKMSSKKWIR
jgi:hypothetical protein